eukprot:TRINITY_DN655_c1_g1_i1.p1 TRINITY_DN655_c1_g1~~TRINITY_DN655_c1_g1_i1.p1  ORF type:complete len:290 (+),score=48.44 TRINITY_DN655_c1_g1_i1:644-1513(+)
MNEIERIKFLEGLNEELREMAESLRQGETQAQIENAEYAKPVDITTPKPTYVVSVIRGSEELPVFEHQCSPLPTEASVIDTSGVLTSLIELEESSRETIVSLCAFSLQAVHASYRYLVASTIDISTSMHKQEVTIDELSIKLAEGIKKPTKPRNQSKTKNKPRNTSRNRSSSPSPKRATNRQYRGYVSGIIGKSTNRKGSPVPSAFPFSGVTSIPTGSVQNIPPPPALSTGTRSTIPMEQSASLAEQLTQISSQEKAAEVRNLMLRREIERVNHMKRLGTVGSYPHAVG